MIGSGLDLLVTGVTLIDHEGQTPGVAVGFRGGRVAVVAHVDEPLAAQRRLDGHGLIAMPGLIDGHVHFRQPGLEYKETFASGSEAAVRGGVTCVLDMPNTEPPTSDAEAFADKVALIGADSWVDFGLFGLLADDNAERMSELAGAGAVGIKCFMGQSERGPGCPLPPDDGALFLAMRALSVAGLRLAVHAENHQVMARLRTELRSAGRNDLAAHAASRPPFVEVEAIHRAAVFAQAAGARLHVVHLSSAEGLDAVTRLRSSGVDVTCETAPHYCLVEPADAQLGSKVNPPIRGGADREALWSGVRDGRVDMLASDHAPHAADERVGPDVWSCRPGVPGVGTTLQLVLSRGVATGALSLSDVVRLLSYKPSRTWDLHPRKGIVKVGADADLVLVDMAASWSIPADDGGPFAGAAGRGRAVGAVVGGRVVMWDGKLVGRPAGRLVRPHKHGATN